MFERSIAASPLQGKRILVTRTREQASVLCEQLRSLGAIPIEFPTIKIVPPQDWTQLDAVLKRLYSDQGNDEDSYRSEHNLQEYGYDWLIFTSANGAHICCERLLQLGYDPKALADVQIATIGPATAAALARYGMKTDLVPDEYIAEGVAAALIAEVWKQSPLESRDGGGRVEEGGPLWSSAPENKGEYLRVQSEATDDDKGPHLPSGPSPVPTENGQALNSRDGGGWVEERGSLWLSVPENKGEHQALQGQHILLARAAEARRVLVTELEHAGALVDEVVAYYTIAVAHDDEQGREIVRLLERQQLDILTFTSSSTVRNFMTWLRSYEQDTSLSLIELVSRCHIACIGPITAQTARELGLSVTIEATEFTIDGLMQAIVAYEGK